MNKEALKKIPFPLRGTVENISNRRGKISAVDYRKPLKPKKKYTDQFKSIEKRSIFKVRAGIEYNNIAVIKEGHESGKIEQKGLPANIEKIDTGVYRNVYNNTIMVGVAPLKGDNNLKTSVYIVDGEEVGLDDIMLKEENLTLRDVLYAKDYKSNSETSEWIMLKVEQIHALSGC